MIDPSNFDEEIKKSAEIIKTRINSAMQEVLREEIEKVMGRVKIFVSSDFKGQFSWFIESDKDGKQERLQKLFNRQTWL